MKTVVITGASGFLGRYIVQEFLKETNLTIIGIYNTSKPDQHHDPRVTYRKCNLYNVMELAVIIRQANYVVHAAAIVSFHPNMEQEMMRFNTESTANIVNLCIEYEVEKLIHISSISALGGLENKEVDDSFDNKSRVRYSKYGESKKASELEVWRGIQEGLTATILNPSLIIGSGNWSQGSPRMIKSVADGLKYYPVGSTGFVYAIDVARLARLSCIDPNSDGQRYLCSATNLPYRTVIQEVAKCLGKSPPQRAIKNIHITIIGIFNKVKNILTNHNQAIITKASLITSSKRYSYNGSKSLEITGFGYTDINIAIKEICTQYLERNY